MQTTRLRRWWLRQPPAAFAFVMATGIVAAAMRDVGAEGLGRVLLALATAAFVVLVAGLALRLCHAPRVVLGELQESSHAWDS